jgi:glycosyltransferase involved in cell wall biosynthesis
MTLKEELEILRGEPIDVFTGDPMDIPCIETSDPEKLCRHPVVSVQMCTYNHEPYIRRAIDGVMMQKTDFEFELVIGEDCSTDKTREICFEYQKKYPGTIRVLWSEKNLGRNPHPAGGNGKRTLVHCRGEFLAYCEGDDYWIDPLKLQKQVDAMRKHPSVGLCFTGAKIFWEMHDKWVDWDDTGYVPGPVSRTKMLLYQIFGKDIRNWACDSMHLLTSTALVRHSLFKQIVSREEIFAYWLSLGDKQMFIGLSSFAGAVYLADKTSVYHRNSNGAMATIGGKVIRDVYIVQMYFANRALGMSMSELPLTLLLGASKRSRNDAITNKKYIGRVQYFLRQFRIKNFRYRLLMLVCILVEATMPSRFSNRIFWQVMRIAEKFSYNISMKLQKLYESV